MRAITIPLCILMIACAPRLQPRLYDVKLPPYLYVDLTGTFTLSPTGELSLALAEPCRIRMEEESWFEPTWKRCERKLLNVIHVVAKTPWGSQVPGVWLDEGHLVFRIDWNPAGLDLSDTDLPALVAQPWRISGATWTPNAEEARQILMLLGTTIETDLVSGGPPPNLEVTRFEIDGGTLRAGGESTLTVQITNRGPGTAYRVAATVRSGIMSLHGQRVLLGSIKPGAAKLRRLQLTLPVSETAPDTMLLVVFDEGNGFPPASISRRVPIAAPAVAPVLAVRCWILGRSLERPDLDAGEDLVVECLVDNSGTGAANVVLEASLAGATPVTSLAKRVAPAGRTLFDLPIAIPRGLDIDSTVEIAITTLDRQFARSAHTSIVGVIRKPRLCATGQLTHTQYRTKLAELRAALAVGDLTQDQFDRYDAELVNCLNDAP